MRPVSIKFHGLTFLHRSYAWCNSTPQQWCLPEQILQWPLPYVQVIGPNYLKVCGAVEPQLGRNQLSSSVYANQTLGHGSGNQHIFIKNGSNRKPDYAKRTPLVDFFFVSG